MVKREQDEVWNKVVGVQPPPLDRPVRCAAALLQEHGRSAGQQEQTGDRGAERLGPTLHSISSFSSQPAVRGRRGAAAGQSEPNTTRQHRKEAIGWGGWERDFAKR